MNRVTPYAMTSAAIQQNPGMMMHNDEPLIGAEEDYEARQSIELTHEQARLSPDVIGEIAWGAYQNIDENRLCPDKGRSMMMGDLVLVEVNGKKPVWMIVAAMGFENVTRLIADRDLVSSS